MMATRSTGSALLKSRIDHMELRLRELERLTTEARESLARLQAQVEESPGPLPAGTFPAPPATRTVVVRRPCVMRPTKVKVVKKPTGRATKFTEEVCANIPLWIEQGLSREQIAARIGCTMNSLQASCSKRGISLWAKGRVRTQLVEVVYAEEEAA
jgi:hypothetical protein